MNSFVEFFLEHLPWVLFIIITAEFIILIIASIDRERKRRIRAEQQRIEAYKASVYYTETGKPLESLSFDPGAQGEYVIVCDLEKIAGHKRFLINAYVPKANGGTAECDIIMLHASGVYVFESKNYSGWIFGTERQQQWTETFKNGHKQRFFNPCKQNAAHIRALQYLCPDISPEAFVSVVVFSGDCELRSISLDSTRHIVTAGWCLRSELAPRLDR